MLKIGAFSSLSRISVRMLRYYDENGLLHPARIDETTGYRYYREEQLALAARIASLRDMGFGVAAIGEVVRGGPAVWEDALRRRRAELLHERDELGAQLRHLDSALMQLGKEQTMQYEVTCKTLPERFVASVRDILPTYNYEGRLWHTLMQETAGLDLRPAEPCLLRHLPRRRVPRARRRCGNPVCGAAGGVCGYGARCVQDRAARARGLDGASRQLREHRRGEHRRGAVGAGQRVRDRRDVVQHLPCQPASDEQSG